MHVDLYSLSSYVLHILPQVKIIECTLITVKIIVIHPSIHPSSMPSYPLQSTRRVRGWAYAGQLAIKCMNNTHKVIHSQFLLFHSPNLHVYGLWGQLEHREYFGYNTETLYRNTPLSRQIQTDLLCGTSANHLATILTHYYYYP